MDTYPNTLTMPQGYFLKNRGVNRLFPYLSAFRGILNSQRSVVFPDPEALGTQAVNT